MDADRLHTLALIMREDTTGLPRCVDYSLADCRVISGFFMKLFLALIALFCAAVPAAADDASAWGGWFRYSEGTVPDPAVYDCANFNELAYGPAWQDNLICGPKGSQITFRNGSPRNAAGEYDLDCTLLSNVEDPRGAGGHDNFLCMSYSSQFRAVWLPYGYILPSPPGPQAPAPQVEAIMLRIARAQSDLARFNEKTGLAWQDWLKDRNCFSLTERGDQGNTVQYWRTPKLCFVPRVPTVDEKILLKISELAKGQKDNDTLVRSDMRTLLNQFCKTYAKDPPKCDEILPPR